MENFTKTADGVLPIQDLRRAVKLGMISASSPFHDGQFQPSSMDLRLGNIAYRVRSSFLPQTRAVTASLEELTMYEIDITDGAILERGNVYIIPLQESLNLPAGIRGRANPKSSTGRLDIFTRVISDRSHRFEDIEDGYSGPLYIEVVPRSFTIKVQSGLSLNQFRLFKGQTTLSDAGILEIHNKKPIIFNSAGALAEPMVRDGLNVSIEIHAGDVGGIIGYMAKKNSTVIDMNKVATHKVEDFWDPIKAPAENFIILEPEEFYIFASKERVRVPLDSAAEMVEFDAGSGELRTHYAGFFDSGFGDEPEQGTKAVLEVRPHDVPFRVDDGQIFFKLRYEKMSSTPDLAYGSGIGSSYFNQGLRLSKHFKMGDL